MSENQKSGQIVRVVAFDRDIDNNARLTYTLVSHANTFLVDTINNEGSVSVFQVHINPQIHRFPGKY